MNATEILRAALNWARDEGVRQRELAARIGYLEGRTDRLDGVADGAIVRLERAEAAAQAARQVADLALSTALAAPAEGDRGGSMQ